MYACWYTMFWQNPPGVTQPQANRSDPNAWKWSKKLDITYNSSESHPCSFFEIQNSPFGPGNQVWMHVQISAGAAGGHDVGVGQFSYQPGAPALIVEAGGTTLAPRFKKRRG